jgi:hypothetical protein
MGIMLPHLSNRDVPPPEKGNWIDHYLQLVVISILYLLVQSYFIVYRQAQP